MFNPIERGRQLREQRQRDKVGCGFCGFAEKYEETSLYQCVIKNSQVANKLRTFADKPGSSADIAIAAPAAEKIRNSSAIRPQATKPTTTRFSANSQNPQAGETAENPQPSPAPANKPATAADVEVILTNLRAVGRDLDTIEGLARAALLKLSRAAAAELAVVIDDLFQTALTPDVARSQCRRVVSDPKTLAAAKALWPDLATLQERRPIPG